MVKFYLVVIIALLSCIFLLEKQAAYCGVAGSYSPELPYGVRPYWINGVIWFVDSDGMGLLVPNLGPGADLWKGEPPLNSSKLKTSNWNEVIVNKILAYSYDAGIYVKVDTSNPLVKYAVIDRPNPTIDKIKLFSEDEFVQYFNNSKNDLTWIPVDIKDCEPINFQRFIAYLFGLTLLIYIIRTIRKNR